MTTRSIAVALALLLAALAFPLAPSPVMANPGSQPWYLTDFTSALSGADYVMYAGSGNGSSTLLTVAASTSKIWAADVASNIVIDMSGTWSVELLVDSNPPSSSLTMDIGVLSGGSFALKGTSASQTVPKDPATLNFDVTTTDHTINIGDYLAVRINCTSGNKDTFLDVMGATDSPCFVTSPVAAPDYPGTVTISFTVTDYGSAGINFGSLDYGTSDNAEADQTGVQGAVLLTVAAETNVNCSVQIKGDALAITIASGTADSGSSSTTLLDADGDFVNNGVAVDDIVINRTDSSTATITAVTATQLTFSGGLSGGSGNTFATDDAYSVREATPAYTIDIGNAKWDTDSDVTGATAMTGTYAQITTSTAGSLTEQDVWHWLSVPSGQVAGDYTGMFYYQAIQQ